MTTSSQALSLPLPDLHTASELLASSVTAIAGPEAGQRAAHALCAVAERDPRILERLEGQPNWMADAWLDSYLGSRGALSLTSNVAFQLRIPTQSSGLERVAELISRITAVHLRWSEIREVDARGTTLCYSQWRVLSGGLRHPRPGRDAFLHCELGASSRSIGIICAGQIYRLQVSNASGQPYAPSLLLDALSTLPDPSTGETVDSVCAISARGSEDKELLSLVEDSAFAESYDALRDFLFMVNLDCQSDQPTAERLARCVFEPGHAWCYKPLTYEISTGDDWLCLHVEHSTVDGATLVELVRLIQEEPAAGVAGNVEKPTNLHVPMPHDETDNGWRRMKVEILHVPRPSANVSMDAYSQLVLNAAQQIAYGRVRSVYESVDMRHYQRGRTECLRPVTPEAVQFAREAVAGEQANYRPALEAHRAWVKACKKGQAWDRYLSMVAHTARELGHNVDELLTDLGVTAVRTDFLSTTSIGSDQQIIRYTFAPAIPGGFGVNYTPREEDIEFCVSWVDSEAEDPERFLQAIHQAAEKISTIMSFSVSNA